MIIAALIIVEITLIALRSILSPFATASNNGANKSRIITRAKKDASLEKSNSESNFQIPRTQSDSF